MDIFPDSHCQEPPEVLQVPVSGTVTHDMIHMPLV